MIPARRSAELVLDEELERTAGVDRRIVGEERRMLEPLERKEELERTVGADRRIVGDERRILELPRDVEGRETEERDLPEERLTELLDRLGVLRRMLELDDLERDTLREPELLPTLRPELERPELDRPELDRPELDRPELERPEDRPRL